MPIACLRPKTQGSTLSTLAGVPLPKPIANTEGGKVRPRRRGRRRPINLAVLYRSQVTRSRGVSKTRETGAAAKERKRQRRPRDTTKGLPLLLRSWTQSAEGTSPASPGATPEPGRGERSPAHTEEAKDRGDGTPLRWLLLLLRFGLSEQWHCSIAWSNHQPGRRREDRETVGR
jgi:hypothetical protein